MLVNAINLLTLAPPWLLFRVHYVSILNLQCDDRPTFNSSLISLVESECGTILYTDADVNNEILNHIFK